MHNLVRGMPHVTVVHGPQGNPIYQAGGRSFVFFRTARPDATDPRTGRRYTDVIMFWVPSEADKQALVQDQNSPFLTTWRPAGCPRDRGCRGSHRQPPAGVVLIRARTNRTGAVREA